MTVISLLSLAQCLIALCQTHTVPGQMQRRILRTLAEPDRPETWITPKLRWIFSGLILTSNMESIPSSQPEQPSRVVLPWIWHLHLSPQLGLMSITHR